jgi:hypothetical protein
VIIAVTIAVMIDAMTIVAMTEKIGVTTTGVTVATVRHGYP